jgi:hypothetical protein
LELDDGFRALQTSLEAFDFPPQGGILGRQGIELGATLFGSQALQDDAVTLVPSVGEVRRIQAFAAEQGTELTILGAAVRLLQDPTLVVSAELAALGLRSHFGVR